MKTQYNSIARKLVLPLMFGMAVMAASAVEAAVVDQVDILNGQVDVNENSAIQNNDDRLLVWLWCNDAAPYRVRIIDGLVDVNEDGATNGFDDASNCDLTDEVGAANVPTTNPVDIINGCVDVNESGACTFLDDASNVQLFTD
jgi:hypothetical protein